MPKRIQASAARGLAVAALLTLSATGSAAAAGPGYGGGGTPPPVTPVGFSTVVTAQNVTKHGGTFKVKYAHGMLTVKVPKNATRKPIQIAITKGSIGTVRGDLPNSLKRYRVVSTFGVEVRNGSSAAHTTKSISITLKASDLKKGDLVLVYSSATGKFTPLTGATVKNGKVVIKLSSGESLAIVAPPRKG